MVDCSETLSDFVNEEDFHFIENNIPMESFNLISTSEIDGSSTLDPMMMNMINTEETTLSMEDYKFISENGYLQSYSNFPPEEPKELCNSDYSGPFNFEVLVDPSNLKNPWEYSSILNKIFIDMKHKFPINFSVKKDNLDDKLFVRVMPMYEEDRYFHELVHRCICHEQLQDQMNQGIPELVAQHIIRCDNVNARYFGDKNSGKRLSIVIPLSSPQAGTDSVKEFFMFVCKNSCPGGMNRRPIQVIFTLENEFGTVLGRRVLCVRICSCPKRDREKEEKKKEKQENPPGKKRKVEKKVSPSTETVDTRLFPFNINIVGEENYKRLVQFSCSLMANEIVKLEGKPGADAPFRKCLNEVNNLTNKFSE